MLQIGTALQSKFSSDVIIKYLCNIFISLQTAYEMYLKDVISGHITSRAGCLSS